jgi:uncharacterized protein (UPF0276 family)
MPAIPEGRISVGAFYNPHLAQELLRSGDLIGHLAMADPPANDDAGFAHIRDRFPLLLHDYLGQLSDPLSPHALERARQLQAMYHSPWVAEHFQCLHTQDHNRTLDYVFPPLYTEDFLRRFEANARVLRDAVDAPLVMENIPGFFSLDYAQMSEGEFLRRFFEDTGCGFLLDLPHIWLAAHYSGRSPQEYLKGFPLEEVVEVHVAGVEEDRDLEGPWIAPTPPTQEILDLAVWVAGRAPKLRAVTFDAFSPGLSEETLISSVEATRKVFGLN